VLVVVVSVDVFVVVAVAVADGNNSGHGHGYGHDLPRLARDCGSIVTLDTVAQSDRFAKSVESTNVSVNKGSQEGIRMRARTCQIFSTVVVSVAFWAGPATADEPHSWCVTGGPLNYPSVASDPLAAAAINHVCARNGFFRCCTKNPGGRWDLGCVQEGHRFAKEHNLGDLCGRDAWVQGPIAGTQQHYPRDFNMFVLGNVGVFRDSEGAIAAQGDISSTSFNLNWSKREPIAVVAQGALTLNYGTVNGAAHYGTSYQGAGVTFVNATPPSAPSQPIDFAGAAPKLQQMSQTLKNYTATSPNKSYSTVTFQASDPELNVFSTDAGVLSGVYSYVFKVPGNSSVIINVTGSFPLIQYAGFDRTTGPSPAKILWNFPDANRLQMVGLAFPGSMLAPNADAALFYGNVDGTVVVKSAVASASWFELHRAPFQPPSYTCSAPSYDPSIWKHPGNIGTNNCYSYATNVLTRNYPEPGKASGEFCHPHQASTCMKPEIIAQYAMNDGLLPTTATAVCPDNRSKVALFTVPATSPITPDYHWVRQDRNGTWSHKLGSAPPSNTVDGTPGGPPITSPFQVVGSWTFGGYFCACSSSVQGGGHTVIE